MKKKFLAVAVIMVLTLCLFGCSKGDKSGDNNTGTAVGSTVVGSGSYYDSDGNIVDSEGRTFNGDSFSVDSYGNIVENNSGVVVGSVALVDNGDSYSYSDDGSYSQDSYPMSSDHGHDVLSLLVYKLNDNTIHARVEDSKNSGIMGTGVNQVYVRITDGDGNECASVSLSPDYGSFGYYTNNSTDWHGSDSTSNLALYSNIAGATFSGNGIANGIRDGLNYAIEVYTNNGNSDPTYGEGKVSVKVVSETELSELVAEEALAYTPKEKAHNTWAGQYLFSNSYYDGSDYVYEYGIANVSITDNGAIRVDLDSKDTQKTYILEEKDYEEIKYDYGTVVEGKAELPVYDYHNSAVLHYTKEVGSPADYYLDADFYENNKSYNYRYQLSPIGASATTAPEGFSDTDKYGYVDAILKDKSNFLYPSGDNYIFKLYKGEESVYNSATEETTYYPCVTTELYEFDINDNCILTKYVWAFENNAAASDFYARRQSWYTNSDTYHLELMGKEVRMTEKQSYYYYGRKYYENSFKTYDGMHYADYEYLDEGRVHYIYSSKAFDSSKRTPGVELIKILTSIPSGSHRSLDSQSASMYVYFSASSYSGVSMDFEIYGDNGSIGSGYYATYDGLTARSITYGQNWENGDYVNYVYVDEVVFGEEEATATRNKYKVNDFSNVTITLDNYKTLTPDSTETHRYDMTRVKD